MAERKDKTSKNLFQIDTEDSPIEAVIDFLDKHLLNFPADFRKRVENPSMIRENIISQELYDFLDKKCTDEVFRFRFQWEQEESNRSPDFALITAEDRNPFGLRKEFFVIEAKKLPTGSGSREKEYVEGNYGGIQRFKKGHHGSGLLQSAIFGYVHADNSSYWHTKINKWIEELIATNLDSNILWNSDDLLVQSNDFGKTKKYHSKNTRIIDSEEDSIELYHYLMELN